MSTLQSVCLGNRKNILLCHIILIDIQERYSLDSHMFSDVSGGVFVLTNNDLDNAPWCDKYSGKCE